MKPLILEYAEKRKGEISTAFQYDHFESLNIISINGEKIPFIELQPNDTSQLTRTKVANESDDCEMQLLELQTRTRVYQESDDIEKSLLELQTKTLVKQERDDEGFNLI